MKSAYIDANVILRFLTGDPPDMFATLSLRLALRWSSAQPRHMPSSVPLSKDA